MDIPQGMAKRQSTFDWQTAQTQPPLHNNNSNTNNKNMIVRDKSLLWLPLLIPHKYVLI